MKRQTWALALTIGLLGAGGATQAALVDAGNGLVNDTVLDITWVANASLSGSQEWDDLVSWAENLVYVYGWAVRPGQIAAAPLPGTVLLMALGFGAMALLRRARRRFW